MELPNADTVITRAEDSALSLTLGRQGFDKKVREKKRKKTGEARKMRPEFLHLKMDRPLQLRLTMQTTLYF